MNQEITISRNTISYLADKLLASEYKNYEQLVEILNENYFVGDKNKKFHQLLWSETEKIKNETYRKIIKEFLDKLFANKKKFIECEFKEDKILSQKSSDKIFLDPLLDSKGIKKTKITYDDLEIHNNISFINPYSYQKLKHSDCTLVLESCIPYDFKKIFEPYLRESTTLKIEDPFLANPKAFNNFKQLIDLFNGNTIEVKRHSEHNYLKHNPENKANYSNLQDYLNTLKSKGLKISDNYFKIRTHFERYIYTDSLKTKLPGGLDFLNEHGKINNGKDDSDIKFVEIEVKRHQ